MSEMKTKNDVMRQPLSVGDAVAFVDGTSGFKGVCIRIGKVTGFSANGFKIYCPDIYQRNPHVGLGKYERYVDTKKVIGLFSRRVMNDDGEAETVPLVLRTVDHEKEYSGVNDNLLIEPSRPE